MINISSIFMALLQDNNIGGVLFGSFKEMNKILANIDWPEVMEIALFIALAGGLTIALLLANDKIFEHYNEKRIKRHHLTIRNNGNVPSIFLFRTIDLPKQLAVRFRIGDVPMIWVSRKEAVKPLQEEEKPAAQDQSSVKNKKNSSETSLVPDLKDPFTDVSDIAGKAVGDARKAVTDVGRKAGLFAGIIGSVTNLLGIKSDTLQSAQGSLKDVQQQSNQAIQSVNSKIGQADTLKNQVSSVIPNNAVPDAAKNAVPGKQGPGSVSEIGGAELMSGDTVGLSQTSSGRDFVFDEEVWRSNIGKIDEKGGDLNYSMSKMLEPGESLKIDVDIMNLSDSSAPVSLMYKIEVLQIPQTKLQFAVQKEYVNGIVIYPKISVMSRVIPFAVIIALIIISIQLLAGYSHLIF